MIEELAEQWVRWVRLSAADEDHWRSYGEELPDPITVDPDADAELASICDEILVAIAPLVRLRRLRAEVERLERQIARESKPALTVAPTLPPWAHQRRNPPPRGIGAWASYLPPRAAPRVSGAVPRSRS